MGAPVDERAVSPVGPEECHPAASRDDPAAGPDRLVRLGAVEMGLDCLRRYLHGLPVHERIDFEKV